MGVPQAVMAPPSTRRDPVAERSLWTLTRGEGPLLAVALHAGHSMRPDLSRNLAIDEATRLREEDVCADFWTQACNSRLVIRLSRFEVDLNRPPAEAVYRWPFQAWGLKVWRRPLTAAMVARSGAIHDTFYAELHALLRNFARIYGRFVVFDLHSYNHRRAGPDQPVGDPELNPEINLGTASMPRQYWAPVVERFVDDLRKFDFMGRQLDVRENVKFHGRYLARYVHKTFDRCGCVLSIEVKKFYMNEWTGEADRAQVEAVLEGLKSTVPGIIEELEKL